MRGKWWSQGKLMESDRIHTIDTILKFNWHHPEIEHRYPKWGHFWKERHFPNKTIIFGIYLKVLGWLKVNYPDMWASTFIGGSGISALKELRQVGCFQDLWRATQKETGDKICFPIVFSIWFFYHQRMEVFLFPVEDWRYIYTDTLLNFPLLWWRLLRKVAKSSMEDTRFPSFRKALMTLDRLQPNWYLLKNSIFPWILVVLLVKKYLQKKIKNRYRYHGHGHKRRCTFSKAHHFGALHLLALGCDAKSLVDMTARVSWVGLGVVWERNTWWENKTHAVSTYKHNIRICYNMLYIIYTAVTIYNLYTVQLYMMVARDWDVDQHGGGEEV